MTNVQIRQEYPNPRIKIRGYSFIKVLLIIKIIVLLYVITSHAQVDTINYKPIKDTLTTDTTVKPTGDVDAIIEYSAKDSAIFDITNNKLFLYNDGYVKYKEFELHAARIILYKDTQILDAFGIPDTNNALKYMGTPVFFESGKKYEGFSVRYNFKTQQGNITMGSTEIEGGFYLGEKIKKVDKGTYFIENGRYTTCDKENPDYYFGSPKMKVMTGDKVVAEPVYLFIDDVPIFAIPFGIFPNHSGRSSGLIPPAYGEDATYGRYFTHLGYFWAINDYTDIAFQGNYFTKGRLDLSSRFRYVKRYLYSGSIELGGSKIRLGEENDLDKNFSDQWRIAVYHNQSFDPTTTVNANVELVSSKTYFNNSTNNLNDLLRQNAISNVTVTKNWEESPNSLSLNYYRDQNLQTGEIDERIPSASFLRSQTFPFRTKNTSLFDLKWYEAISYNYSAQLINKHTKTLQTGTTNVFLKDARGGIKQVLQTSAPLKLGYINLSPFFNYNEVWHNKYVVKTLNSSDSLITTDVSGIKTFRFFNTGISFNTRVIGIFNTNIFGIRGIRHTINPSVTYNYQPDFTKPQWHIYSSYTDTTGKQVKYNMFEKEVFGSAPGGEVQSINFGLGNIFEMKLRKQDSTENKLQLLNLDAAISYNFAADSLKLSELSIGYRTAIGSILNIAGGLTYNFYKYKDGIGRVNQYLFNTDKRIADLTSFNINLSTSLQGGDQTSNDTAKRNPTVDEEYIGIYNDKPPNFKIPWQISLNYNYSINKANPSVLTKSSNIYGNLSFSLTPKWKMTFAAGYDIFGKQFSAPYMTIYRDLHCWELNFNWIPVGSFRGFRFELRIKAPQLHDIKVTKQSNYRGAY